MVDIDSDLDLKFLVVGPQNNIVIKVDYNTGRAWWFIPDYDNTWHQIADQKQDNEQT